VTELDVLRQRRGLVLLSAELQRATLARRIENVERHPVHFALGMAASAASVPLLIKVGSIVARRAVSRRERHRSSTEKRRFSVLALLPLLRFVPAIKAALPKLISFNRRR
jgi:hypothetical protein